MPLRDNLKLDEIRDLYGHSFTKNEIKTIYPYDDRVFCKENYRDKKYTVTYDPYAAMTEESMLQKLEQSRQHAAEGQYRSADDAISDMRVKYGL